eukprot:221726-Chlamydomonas_euryale.AAC.1
MLLPPTPPQPAPTPPQPASTPPQPALQVLVLSHREEEKGHVHGIDRRGARVHQDSEYQWVSPDETVVVPF